MKKKSWKVESIDFSETDWTRHQRLHQPGSFAISGNSLRARSSGFKNNDTLSLGAVDCVASRTRSRTPQNSQTPTCESSLPHSGHSANKKYLSNNNSTPSISTSNHPSTSKNTRGKLLPCYSKTFVMFSYINHNEVNDSGISLFNASTNSVFSKRKKMF